MACLRGCTDMGQIRFLTSKRVGGKLTLPEVIKILQIKKMIMPLLLLPCVQFGFCLSELDLLTIGMVNDMFAESSNDDYNCQQIVTQEYMDDFNRKMSV